MPNFEVDFLDLDSAVWDSEGGTLWNDEGASSRTRLSRPVSSFASDAMGTLYVPSLASSMTSGCTSVPMTCTGGRRDSFMVATGTAGTCK